MKRTPLYRAPLAGLMSLAILASPLPPSALADPPSRPDKPDEKKPPGEKDKSQPKKQAKRVSREQQEEREVASRHVAQATRTTQRPRAGQPHETVD